MFSYRSSMVAAVLVSGCFSLVGCGGSDEGAVTNVAEHDSAISSGTEPTADVAAKHATEVAAKQAADTAAKIEAEAAAKLEVETAAKLEAETAAKQAVEAAAKQEAETAAAAAQKHIAESKAATAENNESGVMATMKRAKEAAKNTFEGARKSAGDGLKALQAEPSDAQVDPEVEKKNAAAARQDRSIQSIERAKSALHLQGS